VGCRGRYDSPVHPEGEVPPRRSEEIRRDVAGKEAGDEAGFRVAAEIKSCRDCGKPASPGHTYCPECLDKGAEQMRRLRRTRREKTCASSAARRSLPGRAFARSAPKTRGPGVCA
jgi:hypothetical protein